MTNNTPRLRGQLRLPAEWEPQAGVLLTWPHPHGMWSQDLDQVHDAFVGIARAIARFQPLVIGCHDVASCERIERDLEAAGVDLSRVCLALCPSDDIWVRDHGPITVYQGNQPRLLDFGFNGWGGKYAHALDDAVPRRLRASGCFGAAELERIEFILEGGSIESDGEGTILTTRRCLTTDTRNAGMSCEQIEAQLRARLGAERVLWIERGELDGDDTDGHIDMLVRFCDARTLAYTRCDDPSDSHFAELAAMEAEVKALRSRDGEPYRLIPLPWPRPAFARDGHRLPLSYANFLILNGAVLVPQYGDPADALALEALRPAFPDRELAGVYALPLIQQHGSVHCASMQLPAGVPLPALGRRLDAA